MLKDTVFLTSTDTTIGFVSQNSKRLNAIKARPKDKKFIKAVNSLDTLKSFTRVPKKYKNSLRRAKKSTFIIKNDSFRVISDSSHLLLLNRLKWAYTTSANLSGKDFDAKFATTNADIIIYPLEVKNRKASAIFAINNYTIKRVRA